MPRTAHSRRQACGCSWSIEAICVGNLQMDEQREQFDQALERQLGIASEIYMSEPVVRISRGFFEPDLWEAVEAKLHEGRKSLEPALKALPGLLHFYISMDATSNSMVNVSVWESLAAAKQMDELAEMLAQRDSFLELGVTFQPIRNYRGLWSITP